MKTIKEIKNLNEFEALKVDQDIHVLWKEICCGKDRVITDDNIWVSDLMNRLERNASDITRELVERKRFERTGVAFTENGDLPDGNALASIADWLWAWNQGDDTIVISETA